MLQKQSCFNFILSYVELLQMYTFYTVIFNKFAAFYFLHGVAATVAAISYYVATILYCVAAILYCVAAILYGVAAIL